MKFKLRDIATSSTTVVFFIVGLSGVMLYFKIFDSQVKELHEILGLAFVAAAVLHVFVNWKAMKNYFKKKTFISTSVIVLAISALFISQTFNQGQNPKGLVLKSVINAPINTSLQVLNIDYDSALKKLENRNYKVTKEETIMAIAKANSISPFKVIAIITSK
jgi:hypothetical protein